MEKQAYGRVYRLGQKKETYFIRVIVEGSIDEEIIKIQNRKLEELERTNQEFDASKQLVTAEDREEMLRNLAGNGRKVQIDDLDWRVCSDDDDDDGDGD